MLSNDAVEGEEEGVNGARPSAGDRREGSGEQEEDNLLLITWQLTTRLLPGNYVLRVL